MQKAGIEYDEEKREYLEEGDGVNERIARPDFGGIDSETEDLIFMQLDLDYCTTVPPPFTKLGDEETTVVRMFGVTKQQHSVMAHIYNFRPYFYARLMSKPLKLPYFDKFLLISGNFVSFKNPIFAQTSILT